MTVDDMAEVLVRSLPRILAIAAGEQTGFVKTIDRRGRIRHVFPR